MAQVEKPVRKIAHGVVTDVSKVAHQAINEDDERDPYQKLMAHLGVIIAQAAADITIEAVGDWYDEQQ